MIEHAGACNFCGQDNTNIIFSRAKEGIVIDTNGKQYIDFVLGFGPVVVGHSNQYFNEKIYQYINNGIHFPGYSIYHDKFADMILKDDESMCFFKTSSETITAAIRLATRISDKKGIIRCGFIGWHDAQIANSISWHENINSPFRTMKKYREGFRGVGGEEIVVNWDDLTLDSLRGILKNSNIGMIIIDAYQIHLSSVELMKKAINLCKENNLVVILDETKTAGRVSERGVSEIYSLDYDMLVLGKAIANGAPLSLLIGKKGVLKYAKEVRITGTFSKEVLSVYCALITQDIMKNENGYARLSSIGRKIVDTINTAIKKADLAEDVMCQQVFGGGMFDIVFKSTVCGNIQERNRLKRILVDNGIVMLIGHPSFVCLAHEKLDFDDFENKLIISFEEWKKNLK